MVDANDQALKPGRGSQIRVDVGVTMKEKCRQEINSESRHDDVLFDCRQ